jgi:chromosome segregation ATPase
VAVAIVAALVACAFAWRDLNAARHAHAKTMLQASREHGARLSEERTRNAAVVDALSMRIADAGKVIDRQRTRLAQQRLEISSLNQYRADLRAALADRDEVISALHDVVREQEAELIAPLEESEAEVHHLPRRILAGHDFVWQELSADDETADMVLPNYEVDRQPA